VLFPSVRIVRRGAVRGRVDFSLSAVILRSVRMVVRPSVRRSIDQPAALLAAQKR
jgi:hypothetical protein